MYACMYVCVSVWMCAIWDVLERWIGPVGLGQYKRESRQRLRRARGREVQWKNELQSWRRCVNTRRVTSFCWSRRWFERTLLLEPLRERMVLEIWSTKYKTVSGVPGSESVRTDLSTQRYCSDIRCHVNPITTTRVLTILKVPQRRLLRYIKNLNSFL